MDGPSQLGSPLQAGLASRTTSDAQLATLRASAKSDAPAQAAAKFESLFASQLVKEMRRGLGEGFFGEGPQADVYAGWLDQFVGEAIAKRGGLHLADQVRASLEQKRDAESAAGLGAAQESRP
jgi:Rod binding domain-containing protein